MQTRVPAQSGSCWHACEPRQGEGKGPVSRAGPHRKSREQAVGRGRSGRGSRSRAGGCVRTTWMAGEAQTRVLSSPLSRLEQVFLQLEPEQTATQASDFRESTSWRKSNKMGRKSCRRGARPTRGCEDAGRFSEGRPPEPSRFSPAGDPLLPRLFHRLALKNTGCTVAGRCPSATAVASRCLPSTSTSSSPAGLGSVPAARQHSARPTYTTAQLALLPSRSHLRPVLLEASHQPKTKEPKPTPFS